MEVAPRYKLLLQFTLFRYTVYILFTLFSLFTLLPLTTLSTLFTLSILFTLVQGCIIRSILPSGMGARGEHLDVFLFSNLGAL